MPRENLLPRAVSPATAPVPRTVSAVPTATSPFFTTAPAQSLTALNSGASQPGCSPSNPNVSTSMKLIAAYSSFLRYLQLGMNRPCPFHGHTRGLSTINNAPGPDELVSGACKNLCCRSQPGSDGLKAGLRARAAESEFEPPERGTACSKRKRSWPICRAGRGRISVLHEQHIRIRAFKLLREGSRVSSLMRPYART